MKHEILNELNLVEDHERECKLATGGLPESIWETYSSFANTNGGTILLGIKEHRDSFTVEGLTDKQIVKYQKDFWSTLNDRNKVSKNILLNHHVVYIPGAANIRNENTNQTEAVALSKEDKILEYIRQNGSISSQKAADIGGYKSKTGARKLLDKMIEKGLITKIGNGPATKYVI